MTFSDRILRFKNYNNENEIDMCQKQTQIDWEQRRYEIAKVILAACYSIPDRLLHQGTPQSYSEAAVKVADALIEELKKK